MFEAIFALPLTDRVERIRAHIAQHPVARALDIYNDPDYPRYYSGDRWVTQSLLDGWVKYKNSHTTLLRRARAEAHALYMSEPVIHPENLYILLDHLKCAAYELPFKDGENFGGVEVKELLDFLEESRVLHHVGTTYHWSAEDFPAVGISLRSASNENFTIVDITKPEPRLLGIMDRFAAPMLLHEQAIYMHEGRQYQVEKLDFDDRKAYVRRVDVDYYTDANLDVNLRVLDVFDETGDATKVSWGEVLITSLVSIFKKMKI